MCGRFLVQATTSVVRVVLISRVSYVALTLTVHGL